VIRRISTVFTALATLVVLSAPAAAFDVLKHWNSANTTTWPSNSVNWRVSTSTMPGMDPNDYLAALQAAFQAWEDVSCSAISFNYQGYAAFNPQTGIYVYVQEGQWDPSVGDAAAFSQSDTSFNGDIDSNIIVFNAVDINWSTANIDLSGYSDVQGVATHEIGHSIGMDHSRHPDATMFFSGGGVELRTLSADDEKGACFLYPSGSYPGGVSCDACNTGDDCTNGNCWNWGGQFDGYAYCMDNCSSSNDCPTGFTCVNIGNPAVPQCYPDNEFCTQAGSNIALGQPCYGHETCQSSLCLVTGEAAFCSQQCTNDAQCGSGLICNSGYCFVAGTKPFGATCTEDNECQSAFCVENLALGTGVCSQPCGNNGGSCPPGSQCLQDIICVPPGGKPNGASCLYPTECLSSYCQSGSCTQPCGGGFAVCPEGTTCSGGFCDGSALGGQCESNADCGSPLVCQYSSAGADFGSCGYDCQPLAGDGLTGCPDGYICDWFWQSWNSTVAGRCVANTGGAGVDESCATTPCRADLVCNLGIGTIPTCHKDCKLNSGSQGCSTGTETCDDLIGDPNDPQRGICVNKFGIPPIQPDTGPEPVPDGAPDAGTPDAGPADVGGPETMPTPDAGPQPDATTPDAAVDTGTPTPDVTGGAETTVEPPVIGNPPSTGGGPSGCEGGSQGPVAPMAVFLVVAMLALRRSRPRPCIRTNDQ